MKGDSNIIPAKIAGVNEIILCSPPQSSGYPNDIILSIAKKMGISEVYNIGGAQAIAALAFGTESIKKVCKITGPGNEYVAEAKRQVFGKVGIDSVAGPSEVLLICDKSMPERIAAIDLLAQAEHDEEACSILVSLNQEFSKEVENIIGKIF